MEHESEACPLEGWGGRITRSQLEREGGSRAVQIWCEPHGNRVPASSALPPHPHPGSPEDSKGPR